MKKYWKTHTFREDMEEKSSSDTTSGSINYINFVEIDLAMSIKITKAHTPLWGSSTEWHLQVYWQNCQMTYV